MGALQLCSTRISGETWSVNADALACALSTAGLSAFTLNNGDLCFVPANGGGEDCTNDWIPACGQCFENSNT